MISQNDMNSEWGNKYVECNFVPENRWHFKNIDWPQIVTCARIKYTRTPGKINWEKSSIKNAIGCIAKQKTINGLIWINQEIIFLNFAFAYSIRTEWIKTVVNANIFKHQCSNGTRGTREILLCCCLKWFHVKMYQSEFIYHFQLWEFETSLPILFISVVMSLNLEKELNFSVKNHPEICLQIHLIYFDVINKTSIYDLFPRNGDSIVCKLNRLVWNW